GYVVTHPGGDGNVNYSRTYASLYVMSKGYLNSWQWIEARHLKKKNNTYDYPVIRLLPAASVTLELASFPDLTGIQNYTPRADINYQFPEDITLRNPQYQPGTTLLPAMDLAASVHS